MPESTLHFHILTLFPDMFSPMQAQGILSRAVSKNLIKFSLYDIRDYTTDRHRQVDDYPFGGGPGMLMKPEPVFSAVASIREQLDANKIPTILMSPQGNPFSQKKAVELSENKNIILICGRYEGFDERIREYLATDEISLGDFIVSGGELPAMLLIDTISRLVPNVVGSSDSIQNDSFFNGLLQFPQYTRPASFRDMGVPDVLLSGNHDQIRKWREIKSLEKTYKRRPDLLDQLELTREQRDIVESFDSDNKLPL
ncbi:tRNA (guanosine(37)-N1)-methyltransferase TrmD [Dehalococcoidia bacterium]|nr:tRNA (guanosine(37)-N1)-methyltransferase TrmD [Dehalococcoidia bacterium]